MRKSTITMKMAPQEAMPSTPETTNSGVGSTIMKETTLKLMIESYKAMKGEADRNLVRNSGNRIRIPKKLVETLIMSMRRKKRTQVLILLLEYSLSSIRRVKENKVSLLEGSLRGIVLISTIVDMIIDQVMKDMSNRWDQDMHPKLTKDIDKLIHDRLILQETLATIQTSSLETERTKN